jgi:hypothetical protein
MPTHPGLGHADATMPTPHSHPIHIETLHDPDRYTHAQIRRAHTIAHMLGRGTLVLVESPGHE